MNTFIGVGRLVRDPEIRNVNGTNVCTVTVAIDREYQKKDADKETDFIRCVAWRGEAEYLHQWYVKGQRVAVRGRLTIRKYVTKDGEKREEPEIILERIENADGAREATPRREVPRDPEPAYNDADFLSAVQQDDTALPFDL